MKIIVNGAAVEVDSTEITYELVQRIAFNGKTDRNHTVTYRGAAEEKQGTLSPGETVGIADGTVFNVYETGGA